MPRFTQETAAAALEVQQLILEWGLELDMNDARDITALCTQDCTYYLAGKPHTGHDAIKAFYAARNDRVSKLQKDGIRTQRHAISNLRVSFTERTHAVVGFLIVNYSKEGKTARDGPGRPDHRCRLQNGGKTRHRRRMAHLHVRTARRSSSATTRF